MPHLRPAVNPAIIPFVVSFWKPTPAAILQLRARPAHSLAAINACCSPPPSPICQPVRLSNFLTSLIKSFLLLKETNETKHNNLRHWFFKASLKCLVGIITQSWRRQMTHMIIFVLCVFYGARSPSSSSTGQLGGTRRSRRQCNAWGDNVDCKTKWLVTVKKPTNSKKVAFP